MVHHLKTPIGIGERTAGIAISLGAERSGFLVTCRPRSVGIISDVSGDEGQMSLAQDVPATLHRVLPPKPSHILPRDWRPTTDCTLTCYRCGICHRHNAVISRHRSLHSRSNL